jgi:hypothetical protein
MAKNDNKAKQLIETGTEIAGAAVGGAIGFLAGGPLGAAGAGVLGVVIAKSTEKLINEVANRHLSHREEIRVGATAAFALSTIRDRLKEGDKPRDDGFFTNRNGEPSSAEEIFEGILLKSKNEHEEKKIKLLGNFFANLAFLPEISAAEANYLLKIAEGLTYRQMRLLTLFYIKPQMPESPLRKQDYSDADQSMSLELIALLQEIMDMYNQGLLVRRADNGSGFVALLSWGDVAPDLMMLTVIGVHLATLLGIDDKNKDELYALVSQLS